MARSSIPGARSPLRGKCGDTVYQVRRVDGITTQFQKAAEESRVNNNTEPQAKARMVMGQIQRMFHLLPDIIKDAYVKTPRGTLSFQHFAKLNYERLRQDRDENWDNYGLFDWRPKYDLTAPAGVWQLADGDLPNFTFDSLQTEVAGYNTLEIRWLNVDPAQTVREFFSQHGFQPSDELWLVYYIQSTDDYVPRVEVAKFKVSPYVNPDGTLEDEVTDDFFIAVSRQSAEAVLMFEDDSTLFLGIGAFQDEDYVVACSGFMVVRRADGETHFSSCNFSWIINQVSPLYGRWYKMLKPSEAFETWFNNNGT